jgi:hypothetical protein
VVGSGMEFYMQWNVVSFVDSKCNTVSISQHKLPMEVMLSWM